MSLKKRLNYSPCPIGLDGLCCKNCLMGPCRILKNSPVGVCGADKDVVIARNILRFVAGGTAAHVGHAYHLLSYLKKHYPEDYIKKKTPAYLIKLWAKLEIIPRLQFEHFKDISEALHASTMGVNADYQDLMKWAIKLGIIDGYYGLYLATELSDKVYGKPQIKKGVLDLGVISDKKVNIAVHGHEPMLAEALVKEVKKYKDVNLVGVCCTGASLLAKYGIPLAANFILQEEVVITGAIEALVVDVQCVMPSLADLCECYHTKLITVSELAKIPGAIHLPIKNKKDAEIVARRIIKIARANKIKRRKVKIPNTKKEVVVGFTEDNIDLRKISEDIKGKKIKGVVAAIGCVNPRVNENWVEFYRKLSKDYVILTTGCQAFDLGKAGLLDGKRVFHLGSCVNNSRVAEVFRKIAKLNKKEITDLPFLVSCPAPITEKAIAIGFFFASLGVNVHFGYPFLIESDSKIEHFLADVLKKDFKSKIFLEDKPNKLLEQIRNRGL